jgi:hypothetical protein
VYLLTDPDGTPRYVGQSRDAAARARAHWWAAHRPDVAGPLAAWLRSLNGPPPFLVLAVVPAADALAAEAGHIQRLRRDPAAHLLNLRPYEDLAGLPGVDPAAVEAAALALRRQPVSAERRARVSAALTGHPVSAETRARISDSLRGRPKSPEHRAAIAAGVARQRQAAG